MYKFYTFLLVSLWANLNNGQDLECSTGLLQVTNDIQPNNCYAESKYYDIKDCLPMCINYPTLIVNANCKVNPVCIPGTICTESGNAKRCAYDMDSCAKYYFNPGQYNTTVFRPTCDPGGIFAPKQCKGERATGRCFCFDSKGNRIFGLDWWRNAEDMTCGCSRRRADLQMSEKAPYFVSLHCKPNGNFEPLQCDVTSEQCFCVDEKTGVLTSPVVPQSALNRLPCYETSTKLGSQYLRQCDSKLHAQAKIAYEFKLHGTSVTAGNILCDGDGAFGPYKSQNGQSYCTWRDGSLLGTFQGAAGTVNCNCARDQRLFQLMGQELTLSCNNNGNYYQFQSVEGMNFCVDKDGYIKSTEEDVLTEERDCQGIYEQGDIP